eukprot:294837-Prymnesium_polylepis.1
MLGNHVRAPPTSKGSQTNIDVRCPIIPLSHIPNQTKSRAMGSARADARGAASALPHLAARAGARRARAGAPTARHDPAQGAWPRCAT